MNQQNNYLLKSLILPFLFASSPSIAMFGPLIKKTVQWHAEKRKHETKLKEIKQLATVAAVDHEIDTLKNSIYKEGLKEVEHITNKPYDLLKKHFDTERDIVKDLLQKENPFITQKHSKKIPPAIYNDTISLLREEKVNPKNITLKYIVSTDPLPQADLLLADSRGAFFSPHLYPYFKKPRIRMYSTLTNLSILNILFTLRHELGHVFLQHSSMRRVAADSCNSDDTYNSNIDKLISIQEREANIYAASKNVQLAYVGMNTQCGDVGHAQIINHEKHCHEMQIAYALMKQKEKLS